GVLLFGAPCYLMQRKPLIWPTICVRNQNLLPIQHLTPSYFPSLV
ncbi:hypothetical protein HMPREF9548_04799, partial [Escherichia coli MS 182-1]